MQPQYQILETGKYNIQGLFVRLEQAIDKVKAKRVILDSLDTLFYGLDYKTLRLEFDRLFSWLKDKKVTAIIINMNCVLYGASHPVAMPLRKLL